MTMKCSFDWRVSAALLLYGALSVASPRAAQAQDPVTLDQYRPAPVPADGFALSRPDSLGHLRMGAQLSVSYANDPLVYERQLGDADSEVLRIVEHQLRATLGVSLGLFDRLVLFAGLPIDLYMDGESGAGALGIQGSDAAGLGDAYLGARARLLGEADDVFGLGLQLTATFPSGSGGHYRGDNFLTLHPELLAEIRADVMRITLNVGARIREDQVFGSEATGNRVTIGDQGTFGLGLSVPLYGTHLEVGTTRVDLYAQLWGSTSLANFFDREETPVEALGGLKLHLASGFSIAASGGAGLTRGFGSPDARVTLALGYTTPQARQPEPPPPVVDTDGDGILDPQDRCPNEPEDVDSFQDTDGCPDPDNDRDQVLDTDDQCPLKAEDRDGFEDEDGCPDPDNDGDGIPDVDDRCPNEAEDVDQWEDTDGCPEPDNDMDGVLDGADACPNEAGVVANNGCPDADRDGDTVVDRLDNCPDEAGTVENHGCRRRQQVVIRENQLEILDKVYFRTNSDRILSRSNRLLDNVALVIRNHPEITLVRVEGHTDSRGDDAYNLDLSQRRARSVMAYLVEEGVEPARLRSEGFGETRPIESNDSREGQAANRRVEFNLGEATTTVTTQPEPANAEADIPPAS